MTSSIRFSYPVMFLGVVQLLTLLILAIPSSAFAAVQKTDGFVCPVFNSDSAVATHNPNAVPIGGGDSTILGPSVSVPVTATNAEGAGSPGGPHASPGDPTYTALWSGQ